MNIGDKIKSRRNELGFTLKEVADKLGVRDATAADVLNDLLTPSKKAWFYFCCLFVVYLIKNNKFPLESDETEKPESPHKYWTFKNGWKR